MVSAPIGKIGLSHINTPVYLAFDFVHIKNTLFFLLKNNVFFSFIIFLLPYTEIAHIAHVLRNHPLKKFPFPSPFDILLSTNAFTYPSAQ